MLRTRSLRYACRYRRRLLVVATATLACLARVRAASRSWPVWARSRSAAFTRTPACLTALESFVSSAFASANAALSCFSSGVSFALAAWKPATLAEAWWGRRIDASSTTPTNRSTRERRRGAMFKFCAPYWGVGNIRGWGDHELVNDIPQTAQLSNSVDRD